MADLVAAARGGELRGATGNDGRWAVALCLKAQESVDTGKVVKF
jgi:myo-inositol 2-dehydrogenase/D-chiro-inositol 1-dehydrogenase